MGWFSRKKPSEPQKTDDDDAPEYPPPDQQTVVWRTLCVGALATRANVEAMARDLEQAGSSVGELQNHASEIGAWVKGEKLEQKLSPSEKSVMFLPLGKWQQQQLLDAHWRFEAFGVLCWSVSLTEGMPPWDRSFYSDRPRLAQDAGILFSTREVAWRAKLRPRGEISAMQVRAKGWNWRARTTRLIKENHPLPQQLTWDELLKISSHGHHQDGDIPPPIRDDFPVLNKAYRELTDEEYPEISSIAEERHFAMNWLCGYSKEWDSTPTGT